MAKVYILHGCPDKEEKDMSPEARSYDKHWMPWLERALIAKGFEVVRPHMLNPWEPNYEAFKEAFEKHKVSEDDILVGHSCGGAFFIRWLGETKQKVSRLILVAPWKIANEEDEARKKYYEFPIDTSIKDRVGEIVIFTADDEIEDGKESVRQIHEALGGKIIELKGRGHYTLEDMGSEAFPELLNELI